MVGVEKHMGRKLFVGNLPFTTGEAELQDLFEQAGAIVLTDLGSRAGTFVRITGQREILDGDEIAIGRTRLRVSLP